MPPVEAKLKGTFSDQRAVVIGGGLGGLAVALRLRRHGFQVTICEAGPTFGGKMNRWESHGFRFDTGPSLITMPWVFRNLFTAVDARLEDYLHLVPLDVLSDYTYADGTRFTYSPSLPAWLTVVEKLEPRDVDGFLRFLNLGSRLYEVSRQTFLKRTPYDPPRWEDLGILKHFPVRHGWGNYHRTISAHFQSPYLRQLYDRYPTYVGSSPYLSPATLAVIPYIEYVFGAYYVRGGLFKIVESLVCLAQQNGVAMRANARVDQILTEGARAVGVRLRSGETLQADVVVMNGDEANTNDLLSNAAADTRRRKSAWPSGIRTRSMSGFVLLFGLSRRIAMGNQHNVYFSGDYRNEFSQIFDEQQFPDDPTVYVNIPSLRDRLVVPNCGGESLEGGETIATGEALFVMANAPATAAGDATWTASDVRTARERVLARLRKSGFPDFERDIVVQDVWTPNRISERYLMPGGAIYGCDSHGWRNAFLRPRNQNQSVRGLYHVGGSTHPGGGTPTVLLSAEITERLITGTNIGS